MISLLRENPIFTVTVILLTVIVVGVIKQYDHDLGEILGTQMVWPFVADSS